MKAAILSIGSEILTGTLLDTNAQHFARELTALGLPVSMISQVGDDRTQIRDAISNAAASSRVVVTTGGLGPTGDDLTREAISDITGELPAVDAELLEEIRRHFASRGLSMPEQNAKQAWRIPSARVIPNPNGTAPGWVVDRNGSFIIAMPGPPRENQPMWRNQILPIILPRILGQVIVARTLKTIGIGESSAVARLEGLIDRDYPSVATYAKQDGVHIRITAVSESHAQALAAVEATVAEIRDRIGDHIYGNADDSLAGSILAPLYAAGVKMAVWEAGSAGHIAELLQAERETRISVPEVRVSSYELALDELGVQDDVALVARRGAQAMSRRTGLGTNLCVSLKVEPGEPADRAHGSLGICLLHPDGLATRTHVFTGSEAEIRRRAMLWTAEMLWFELRAASGLHRTERTTSQLSPMP